MEVEACLAEENLSLGTFAVRIGVSHETVRRYIRGSRTLQLTTAHRIAWATGGRVTALNSGEIIKSTGPLVQSATGNYPRSTTSSHRLRGHDGSLHGQNSTSHANGVHRHARNDTRADIAMAKAAFDFPAFARTLPTRPKPPLAVYCLRRSRTMPCSELSMEARKRATSGMRSAVGRSSSRAFFRVRPRR